MNRKDRWFKLSHTSFMIMLAMISTSQLSFTVLSIDILVYAYSNNQAQSLANDCGIDGSSGINCANNGPQNVGDGTATALTPLQISNPVKEGPPGPPGPQGSQGPKGDKGDPGPAGPKQVLQISTVNATSVLVPAAETRSAVATCPSGEVATGGGLLIITSNTANVANPSYESKALGTTSWLLTFTNPSGPGDVLIQPQVVCAKLVDAP